MRAVVSVYRYRTDASDPWISVWDTIRLMRHYAYQDATFLKPLADEILSNYADSDIDSSLNAIYYWVKRNIVFQPDEYVLDRPDKELLISPRLLVLSRKGDCDDFSMLTASLLIAADIPVSICYVTVAADPTEPERFSHVYVVVTTPDGRHIALDTSHGLYPGWETEDNVNKKVYWPIKFSSRREVNNWIKRRAITMSELLTGAQ